MIKQSNIFFTILALALSAFLYFFQSAFKNTLIFSSISTYLFFFILGVGLSSFKEKILSASMTLGGCAFALLLLIQWLFHSILKIDPYVYSWQVLLLGSISIIALFTFFSAAANKTKSSYIIKIGKAAFVIYLLHFLLVGGIRVLLVDILKIEHVWLNLIAAFGIAIIGGLLTYHYAQVFRAGFLWRAPHFLSTQNLAKKISHLWQQKPISKPISLIFIGLLASPFIGVYALSEVKINQEYETISTSSSLTLSTDPQSIANGKRLSQVYGCYLGCHAPEMQGQVLEDKAFKGRIVAPNLTRSIDKYSIEELDVIVRQGLLPNQKALRGWMPTEAYQYIDDQSLSDILSFISAAPKQNNTPKNYRLGWLSRIDLLTDKYKNHHKIAKSLSFDPTQMSKGERLARSTCGECHGADLGGSGDAPPLQIVKAYAFDDFKKLQQTGIAMGDREIGLMSLMARNRFSLLTDDELESLYNYLIER